MALLEKGGGDSINVFGHKLPIALVGGVAAVAGVLLVLRARKGGQTVAAVGSPPVSSPGLSLDPGLSGFGSSFQPDISGQLSNITAQLTGLTQNGTPTSSATLQSVELEGQSYYGKNSSGQSLLELWSGPNTNEGVISLPAGSLLKSAGSLVKGQSLTLDNRTSGFWQPVQYNGATYYVWAPDTMLVNA